MTVGVYFIISYDFKMFQFQASSKLEHWSLNPTYNKMVLRELGPNIFSVVDKHGCKHKKITPASDPKQCVGGQQQKILCVSLRQPPNTRRRDKSQEYCLQDICLCLLYTSYLKILCRSHVSDSCRSVHQWGSATRSTSSDSCLNIFVSQAPLQDPCLWIHVSASMCISGSSARSMLPDSKLSSHMYLRILYKIHVFRFMSQHLCISWILCKIHVNVSGFMSQQLYISGSSASSMSPDPCLRFMSQHPYVSQEPLQNPCLRIRISGSSARSMCPIHVSASIYLRVPARSMSSDSCLSIVESQAPLQDPCLRIRI